MSNLRPDEFDILAEHERRLRDLEAGCGPFFDVPSIDFQNGWDSYGDPFEPWGYRICDGDLEFRGHITGGASGTVFYVLPFTYLIYAKVPTWLTDVATSPLPDASFQVGRIFLDMTSGEMTITI